MVDRHARHIAAEALEEFMGGSISNREYERRFPRSKNDPALWGIYSHIWYFYSDTSEHTLAGKHALTDETRAFIERCLMFLRSNLEFQWPATRLLVWYPLLRLVGLGWIVNRQLEKEMSVGDMEVWPFLNKNEHKQELARQGRVAQA